MPLLKIAPGESREVIDLSGEEAAVETEGSLTDVQEDKKTDLKHYVPFFKRAFRVVLVVFLFFIILRLWGIDLSVGRIKIEKDSDRLPSPSGRSGRMV